MSEFSPLMLTVARESRRMSQTALANATGITQGAVSQMESGTIASPQTSVVGRIADALEYRASLFYAPLRFQQLPITFFRKRTMAARDVSAIRAKVNLFRLRIETLLRAEERVSPRILQLDCLGDGVTPIEVAQRLRVFWNIAPGPIQNLTELVERYGVMVVPMDFGTGAVDGLSLFEPRDTLPPMVFLNVNMPADRWRLTLAHELGHIIMHHHLPIPPSPSELEAQAFEFAGELLAPHRELAGQLSRIDLRRLAQLKSHWRVSMAYLLRTAAQLGRVKKSQERGLWIALRRGGVDEPVSIESERPQLLRGLVRSHLDDLGYTVESLSRALHMRSKEFRNDFDLRITSLRLA